MMVIGKIIKKREKAHFSIVKKEKYIREILLMTYQMEKEFIILKMGIDVKECLKMGKNMEKV